MEELKVYFSAGWFNEVDERIYIKVMNYLKCKKGIKPYFPRYDGIKLEANQFHDPKLRANVFKDNVDNILSADFIVTNIDGRINQDTGTVWEDGYANAVNIPIIAYQDDENGKIIETMGSVCNCFYKVCTGLAQLDEAIDSLREDIKKGIKRKYYSHNEGSKVLFVSPDNNEECIKKSTEVANVLIEGYSENFKWVDKLNGVDLTKSMDNIFNDVQYMVAVIDDRNPVVSFIMGEAYARNIPTISYTNYDYGVNLMLAISIRQHVKGTDNLSSLVHKIKREGLDSLDFYDNSNLKVY